MQCMLLWDFSEWNKFGELKTTQHTEILVWKLMWYECMNDSGPPTAAAHETWLVTLKIQHLFIFAGLS